MTCPEHLSHRTCMPDVCPFDIVLTTTNDKSRMTIDIESQNDVLCIFFLKCTCSFSLYCACQTIFFLKKRRECVLTAPWQEHSERRRSNVDWTTAHGTVLTKPQSLPTLTELKSRASRQPCSPCGHKGSGDGGSGGGGGEGWGGGRAASACQDAYSRPCQRAGALIEP